jgi:uncharacterized protein (DUF608 family)
MSQPDNPNRRSFLSTVLAAPVALAPVGAGAADVARKPGATPLGSAAPASYPRVFTGSSLKMLSFPLGGIGAGSIGLGGRGQLRDWQIFNCADQGNSPDYAFASIWAQTPGQKPVVRVLESRIQTPYEGENGLGSRNAPGLSRLEGATFTGEFPLARIDFQDRHLPVKVSLEAGTPFIPMDADESGLPIASLRYRVRNHGKTPVDVAIAFSIDNPVRSLVPTHQHKTDSRSNEIQKSEGIQGLLMRNPGLAKDDPGHGSFALAVLENGASETTMLRGWPAGRWWNSPLLYWDDFSADGALGPEAEKIGAVGALCVKRRIMPGAEAVYHFVLAWHFPNRTPKRCGWEAPKGYEESVIGNWYTKRFDDAWESMEYAAAHLESLNARTRRFAEALRESTLPPAVKEAASANLSTLVSPTCFRTSDGEFHGFEGVNDHLGCCFGNCTHVWNYETATANLFPDLSQSLRRSAFGYSMDERGAMYFRQLLPDGIERSGFAAADGQMGQIVKVYIDWQLSGKNNFLSEFWPKVRKAIEFCWVPGGWDANRDGVMEGVQHNTYDVEFYGPNPLCGVYYLAALRAAEEMARAMGDTSASEYRRLFESGSRWLDENLFNGEYYIQQIRGYKPNEIAAGLRSGMGADDPEHPQYQLGDGCLVDQLLGQYLSYVAGLGALLKPENMQSALDSIYNYNHKPALYNHDCVQRTFALNDEAAMVICDYGKGERPKIPFPYYAEVMTGFEHSTAALMLYSGMIDRGVACVADIRRRYDGVRRNPWDEAECGHHYARAMASWSSLLALSGFRYRGVGRRVIAAPPAQKTHFRCFWSAGGSWGSFALEPARFTLGVTEGGLPVRVVEFAGSGRGKQSTVEVAGRNLKHKIERRGERSIVTLDEDVNIGPNEQLSIAI